MQNFFPVTGMLILKQERRWGKIKLKAHQIKK